jgi:hypothetical protein
LTATPLKPPKRKRLRENLFINATICATRVIPSTNDALEVDFYCAGGSIR